MLETRMNCVVVTASEVRNRARFLVEPLLRRHHLVGTQLLKLDQTAFWDMCCWFRPDQKPDVIMFVGIGFKSIIRISIAFLSGAHVILRLGGNPIEDIKSDLDQTRQISLKAYYRHLVNYAANKIVLRWFRYIICVNDDLADRMRPHIGKNAEVFVVPQFCDGKVSKERSFVGGSADCLTIANLNYVSKARGVIWLIREVDRFCERTGRPATFRIAGDGICKSVIDEFLESFDRSTLLRVEILGFVQDVDKLYSAADVFLYHSEHDGTPNVLLEAKRWGIPTLVNNYAAFRSIIADGETGFIFEDEDQFQDKFERLIDDRTLRLAISCGARRDHESRFSIDAVGSQLEDVLQRICEQHANR